MLKNLHRLMCLAFLAATIGGCKPKTVTPSGVEIERSPIQGIWTIPSGNVVPTTTVELTDDYHFRIVQGDPEVIIGQGQYLVTGNELILQNDGETSTQDCTMSATYSFTRENDTLKFERLVDDACDYRFDLFNQIWFKQ